MFKIIKKRKIWFIASGLLVIISIILILTLGLRIGIDYTGGTIAVYESDSNETYQNISDSLVESGINSYQIKVSADKQYTIRTIPMNDQLHKEFLAVLSSKNSQTIEIKYDSIGPTIGKDLTNKSIFAVIFASIGIILFIAFSFRKVPKPFSSWKFGLFAVVALLHDLIIVTGIVAFLGYFLTWMEVDALFITALLTIMGFSVHDTIVVYDRLRETVINNPHNSLELSAEQSVNQTLARSINTSITTVFILLALFILGGDSIKHFVLVLMIGIIIGTYSSIFLAVPVLVSAHKGK